MMRLAGRGDDDDDDNDDDDRMGRSCHIGKRHFNDFHPEKRHLCFLMDRSADCA